MLSGHNIADAASMLETALDRRRAPTVLVSNEVALELFLKYRSAGRSFRDEAGRLNQRIAARAGHVLFMVAGLPLTLK